MARFRLGDSLSSKLVPPLSRLEIDGAATARVERFNAKNFAFVANGASHGELDIHAGMLAVMSKGASNVTVRGTAARHLISANSASHYEATGLSADQCSIFATGASHIKLKCGQVVEQTSKGASHVRVIKQRAS